MDDGDSPASTYLAGLSAGLLQYQRCEECLRAIFYPRVLCPFCGGADVQWHRSDGLGVIYAHTWVFDRSGGYSVALVDLDEGFRMMSAIVGATPESISTGMRVRAGFDGVLGDRRVVFSIDGAPA